MGCSATTTPSRWFRRWKPWAYQCCSTNVKGSRAAISASIWPGSTTPTSLGSTTSKGCVADPARRVFDPVISYPGSLSSGCPCQFQSDAERPHPWRPALSSWVHPDQAGGGVATTNGGGSLAVPQHERLHFRGCRIERHCSAPELSAGNHPALPSARLMAG